MGSLYPEYRKSGHYLLTNLMGIKYRTGTGRPCCSPGFQFGISLTTRRASSSQPYPIPFNTCTSCTSPVESIRKFTKTLPVILLLFASAGILRWRERKAINAWLPPGNSGIVSAGRIQLDSTMSELPFIKIGVTSSKGGGEGLLTSTETVLLPSLPVLGALNPRGSRKALKGKQAVLIPSLASGCFPTDAPQTKIP